MRSTTRYAMPQLADLPLKELEKYNRIGLAAGASTPDYAIKEVIASMSEKFTEDSLTMEDLMEENVVSVNTLEDQETVARMFSDYNLNVLPVVDQEGRMVGIVTVDDAIDVMEEEATEDISKMAAFRGKNSKLASTGTRSIRHMKRKSLSMSKSKERSMAA